MRVLGAGACLAATIVLAVGCGDDDADEAPAASDDAGADVDDLERQADEETAAAMLLTIEDFPPGWEASPDEDDEDDDDLRAGMAECLDVDVAELDPDHPMASSPQFASPDEEEVGAEVTLTPSPEAAGRTLEIMKDDATPGCYADAVKAVMTRSLLEGDGVEEGVAFGEPTFNRLSFADLGDDSVAFRLTIPVSGQGINLDFYIDVVIVRVGRVGIATTFLSPFSPFDTDEAARLTQTIIDRVPPAEAA